MKILKLEHILIDLEHFLIYKYIPLLEKVYILSIILILIYSLTPLSLSIILWCIGLMVCVFVPGFILFVSEKYFEKYLKIIFLLFGLYAILKGGYLWITSPVMPQCITLTLITLVFMIIRPTESTIQEIFNLKSNEKQYIKILKVIITSIRLLIASYPLILFISFIIYIITFIIDINYHIGLLPIMENILSILLTPAEVILKTIPWW